MADPTNGQDTQEASPTATALHNALAGLTDPEPEKETDKADEQTDETEVAEETETQDEAETETIAESEDEKPLPPELQRVMTKLRQKDAEKLKQLEATYGKKAEAFDALVANPKVMALLQGETEDKTEEKPGGKEDEVPDDVAQILSQFGLTDPKQQSAYMKLHAALTDKLVEPKLEHSRKAWTQEQEAQRRADIEFAEFEAAHADSKALMPQLIEAQKKYGYALTWEDAYRLVAPVAGSLGKPGEQNTQDNKKEEETERVITKRRAATKPPAGGGTPAGGTVSESTATALHRALVESGIQL